METPVTDRRISMVQSLKRRSFACTPARQKDSQSSATSSSPNDSFNFGSSDSQNDDEAELRQRQKNRVVDLHHNAFASPKSSTEKRRSLVLPNGVTNGAIADHYKSCIKLSTENKITTKNAFDLNLIDYMPYMFSKSDSDLNNFQVASCTLDAGVKIYACRVDAVHTDILKMAGGLGKEAQNMDNAAEGDENVPKTYKKSKAKPKHGENVETNLASIDAVDTESGTRINPLTRFLAGELKFLTNQIKGSVYQYFHALEVEDSMNVLLTHSDLVPKSECTASFSADAANYPMLPVSFLRDLPKDIDRLQICPEAKGFFNPDWKFDDDNFSMSPNKRASLLPPPFVLDDVGEQDEIPPNDEPLFEGMDDAEGESYHEDDGFADVVEHVREAGPHVTPPLRLGLATVGSVLEKGPSEYSYFSGNVITVMGRAGWAGPLHWKLKPMTLGKPKGGAKEEGNERKRRKKDPLRLRYEDDAPDWKSVKAGLVKPKVPMQLSHATCKQWDTAKITLPQDIHYDTENFGRFDLYPGLRVSFGPSKTVEEVEGVADYDYDSRRDADFCPASQEDDHDYNESGGFVTCAAFGETCAGREDDQLVAEPNKARPEVITFAKKAKNMDMKRLKSTIWNVLNEDTKKPEEAEEMPSSGNAHAYVDFYSMYHKLPSVLPPKMTSNLSVSLAFIATLHLANENNLMLEAQADLRSFKINMP